ncbi:serine palmitoyltransferase [Xylaria bambusicola]|uniref:serine palmitoyltransferase n=1 Tax=Xylaria bambusicola TaxID=326684 RepID=UPI00200780F8|nr:serine palmitoyltransferase [Xylaria bambusicola]KAI0512765.1 serine palmitoyltransferase [Xylaria bambusicola]
MPRKLAIPFSGSAAMPQSERTAERRPSQSKGNRLSQFFSSPKNREQPAAQQALMAMQNNPTPTTTSTLALPSILLSSAAVHEHNNDESATIYEPLDSTETSLQRRRDAQFGPQVDPAHSYVSMHHGEPLEAPVIDEPPYYYVLTTYISYLLLLALGHVRDYFGKRFSKKPLYKTLKASNGYAPLNSDFDSFYTRRLKLRIDDTFARTTTGVPGRYINLLDRVSDNFNESYKYLGTTTETLNMSSYNYLGFAQSEGPCANAVEDCVQKHGLSFCSSRADAGTSEFVCEVEQAVAEFVGKPDAMVFSMGFVTNASTFPALVSKGCLIISDELNHASIRLGARLSGAVIRSFRHNDMTDLEKKLREAIAQGQPRTHRPWKKILVAVEGLYSMEGTMVDLPGVLNLKDTYKFHLYVDEAHSIGALGPRGRGVCDYFGIDPSRVDILMGTLTKSFGANGGYIAADKVIIDKLRSSNAATMLGESPSPAVLMQIYASLKIITGDLVPGEGEERLQRIAFNSRYLRLGLKRLGMIVYGHDDSPIIPIALYNPAKIPAFSHEMLKRKISVVVVGYPATPLISSRARFCVSAAHNKDDLDRLLAACDEVASILQLKFSTGIAGGLKPLPEGVTPETEAAWRKANGLKAVEPPRWSLEDVVARGATDAKLRLR